MKIDPNDKLLSSSLNKPKPAATASTAFADVLKKSIGTEPLQQATTVAPINPVIPPLMASSSSEVYRSTEHMLDTMERYQQLLQNSNVNMRGMDAAVGNLKEEMSILEPLVDQMPDGNPIKEIARQTLLTAAKEIARYDGGNYI